MNVISVIRYEFSLVFSYLIIHQCSCNMNFCLREENDTFDLTIKNPWAEKTEWGNSSGVEWGKYGENKKIIDGHDDIRKIYDNRASFFDTWGLKLKKITPQDSGQYCGAMLYNGETYKYSIKVSIIDIRKLQNEEIKITPIDTGGSVHQLTCGQDWQSGPVSLIQLKNLNDSSEKIKSFIQQDGLWYFRVPENKSYDEYTCEVNTTSLCDICPICNSKLPPPTTKAKWKLNVTLIVLSCIGAMILPSIVALVFWYFTKYQRRNNTATERDETFSAEALKTTKTKKSSGWIFSEIFKRKSTMMEVPPSALTETSHAETSTSV